MMLGVGAIAFSSAAGKEQAQWQEAAQRESRRYNISEDYVEARMQGLQMAGEIRPPRTVWDWILVAVATGTFVFFAILARAPRISFHWGPAVLLITATMVLLLVCGITLWRTTRFN
jgi:hypothetical protein